MRPGRPDVPSLVGGFVLIALGVLLLADHHGELHLRFDAVGPIACAAIGAIFLAFGLARRR